MSGTGWRRIGLGCLLGVGAIIAGQLAAQPPGGFAGRNVHPHQVRIPCERVMSAVNRSTRRTMGAPADISEIAEKLGTSVPWVERCMLTYGRRPKRPGHETAEAVEARLERLEEDEPEETAREDAEEAGAVEIEELPEKQRIERIDPRPTPDPITDTPEFLP
jgi:hypothetical protein